MGETNLEVISERLQNTIDSLKTIYSELKASDMKSDSLNKQLQALEIKLETIKEKVSSLPNKDDLNRTIQAQKLFEGSVKSSVKTWLIVIVVFNMLVGAASLFLKIPRISAAEEVHKFRTKQRDMESYRGYQENNTPKGNNEGGVKKEGG